MDKSRPSFQLKRHDWGDRLIWRQPGSHRKIAEQLVEITGEDEIPKQITIGYVRRLADPPNAIAFMPCNTPMAIAALQIDMVQMRLCEDLVRRLKART